MTSKFFFQFSALFSALSLAAIFGFFYAWVCSTMWGLDQATPQIAINAMQAMNASVRNAVFAPAFFGTSFALLITAGIGLNAGYKMTGLMIGAAGLICFFGYFLVTIMANVPLNEMLAQTDVPNDLHEAQKIWSSYSVPWQFWNSVRTIFSGLAMAIVIGALVFVLPGEMD